MKQIIELLFLVLFFAVTKSKKISQRKSEMASEKRIKGRIQRFVSDPREPTLSEIWTKLENIGRIAGPTVPKGGLYLHETPPTGDRGKLPD